MWTCHFNYAGYAELVKQMFPFSPDPNFSPNFTGYDLDNIDWYHAYKAMAQPPQAAIIMVCRLHYIFSQLPLNSSAKAIYRSNV